MGHHSGHGFQFPSNLPTALQRLPQCQSIIHHHDQWEATVDTLQKFLLARTPRRKNITSAAGRTNQTLP